MMLGEEGPEDDTKDGGPDQPIPEGRRIGTNAHTGPLPLTTDPVTGSLTSTEGEDTNAAKTNHDL